MPRVICSLPNAGHLINGVRFASLGDAGGMLSEEISEDVAGEFLAIRGYTRYAKPIDTTPQPQRNAHRAPPPADETNYTKASASRQSAASQKETT